MADIPIGSPISATFPGNLSVGVRKDTPASLAGTDAYAVAFQCDAYGAQRMTLDGGIPTYTATSQFACDSTGTDIWLVAGSTAVVAKLLKIIVTTYATAKASGYLNVVRRSAVNTAGTSAAPTIAEYDTRNVAASLAPIHYTVHPNALGASAGVLAGESIIQQAIDAVVAPARVVFDFQHLYGAQALRIGASVTDIIAVNAAAALGGAGNIWSITAVWQELPTTA